MEVSFDYEGERIVRATFDDSDTQVVRERVATAMGRVSHSLNRVIIEEDGNSISTILSPETVEGSVSALLHASVDVVPPEALFVVPRQQYL